VGGTGADAVVPGGQHHVLSASPGVELVPLGLGDDDGDGGGGHPPGEAAEGGDGGQAPAVAHDDEAVGLAVLGAAGHAAGLQDAPERVLGDRPGKKGALVALVHDSLVGVHRSAF